MGGMVFAKFFTASPGILSSSFRTADIDLTFTNVRACIFGTKYVLALEQK